MKLKLIFFKKVILFSLFFVTKITVFAQISKELQEVTPKSPTAEEFKRQVDFPVGFYTGIPDISIDLYSINLDDKEIPISLSYLASGIQVDQRATWAGLGWSLNAGGAIVRNLRGGADDNNLNYFGYSTPQGKGSDLEYFLNLDKMSRSNMSQTEIDYTEAIRRDAADGLYDTEPDIYTFNALGLSGKFIISHSGEIISISHQDYNIEGSPQTGFKIVDQLGFIYTFNASETTLTIPENPDSNDDSYNSSWFLSELTSPNGNTVTFTYANEFISYTSPKSATHTYCQNSYSQVFSGNTSYSFIESNSKRLARIDFPKGYIVFKALTNREDLNGSKQLNNIEVYNISGNLVKNYNLKYDYFVSDFSGETDSKRLKLLKLNNVSATDTLTHEFKYNNTNMPRIGSYARDYWGYYNGQDNNNSPIPNLPNGTYSIINPYNDSQTSFQLNDDNHTNTKMFVSPVNIKTGLLKEVIYPTGGKTSYEFELNHFNFRRDQHASIGGGEVQQQEIKTIVARAVAASSPYDSDPNYDNTSFGDNIYGNLYERFIDFYVPSSGTYKITYRMEGEGNPVASSVKLLKGSEVLLNVQNGNYYSDENITLGEGTYTLSAMVDDDARRSVILIESVEYISTEVDADGNPIENPVTGGVRIKEINKFDSNGELVIKRTYDYLETDNETSSGVVLNSDLSFLSGIGGFQSNGGNGETCNNSDMKLRVSSSSVVSYGSTKGSSVGYKRVVENFINYNTNDSYKNVYEFTSAYDFPSDDIEFYNAEGDASDYNYAFPYTQRIINDYRRGLLKRKISYDSSNQRVYETINNYVYKIDSLSTKVYGANFAFNTTGSSVNLGNVATPYPFYLFVDYNHYFYDKIYRANKSNETTISYLNGQIISTITNFYYEKPISNLLTKTETINSKNETLTTEIYYPDDVNDLVGLSTNEIASLNSLVARHRIAEPIQVTNRLNTQITSIVRSNFKDWGVNADNSFNLILPDKVQISKNDDALEDRIIYHSYDNKGNPLEVSKADGTSIYYIWGYNKQYPIGKLENFTSAQSISIQSLIDIAIAVSEDDNDRTLGYAGKEGDLREALDNIRNHTNLENTMVTTYTYDPLIGITSITNPKGYTMYYEYDDFNRLKQVKDQDGNILNQNEYNYKPQN